MDPVLKFMKRDTSKKKKRRVYNENAQESKKIPKKTPIKEGFLRKQGNKGLGVYRWKRRWFSLVGSKIYYGEDMYKDPIGFISLTKDCQIRTNNVFPEETFKECSFLIQNSPFESQGRIWNLCAQSKEEKRKWMEAIQSVISEKRKKNLHRQNAVYASLEDINSLSHSSENKEIVLTEQQIYSQQQLAKFVENLFDPNQVVQPEDISFICNQLHESFLLQELAILLNQQRAKEMRIPDTHFDEFCTIIDTALNFAEKMEEFRSGKILMNMCFTFYRIINNITDYCYQHLNNIPIWKNMKFWSFCLTDCIRLERDKVVSISKFKDLSDEQQEEFVEREKNIAFSTLTALAYNMLSLNVPDQDIKSFVFKWSSFFSFQEEQINHLKQTMESFSSEIENDSNNISNEAPSPRLIVEKKPEPPKEDFTPISRRVEWLHSSPFRKSSIFKKSSLKSNT